MCCRPNGLRSWDSYTRWPGDLLCAAGRMDRDHGTLSARRSCADGQSKTDLAKERTTNQEGSQKCRAFVARCFIHIFYEQGLKKKTNGLEVLHFNKGEGSQSQGKITVTKLFTVCAVCCRSTQRSCRRPIVSAARTRHGAAHLLRAETGGLPSLEDDWRALALESPKVHFPCRRPKEQTNKLKTQPPAHPTIRSTSRCGCLLVA